MMTLESFQDDFWVQNLSTIIPKFSHINTIILTEWFLKLSLMLPEFFSFQGACKILPRYFQYPLAESLPDVSRIVQGCFWNHPITLSGRSSTIRLDMIFWNGSFRTGFRYTFFPSSIIHSQWVTLIPHEEYIIHSGALTHSKRNLIIKEKNRPSRKGQHWTTIIVQYKFEL